MSEARSNRKGSPPSFPALVQQFFTEYLVAQRALSPRTVASYRDAMTLYSGMRPSNWASRQCPCSSRTSRRS